MKPKKVVKVKRGRPSLGERPMMAVHSIRLPDAMRQEIDAIAASRLDQPDVAQIVRELLAEALAARKRRAAA